MRLDHCVFLGKMQAARAWCILTHTRLRSRFENGSERAVTGEERFSEIGSAECREGVQFSVVGGSLKNKGSFPNRWQPYESLPLRFDHRVFLGKIHAAPTWLTLTHTRLRSRFENGSERAVTGEERFSDRKSVV